MSSAIAAFYWHGRDSTHLPILDFRASKDHESGYLAITLLYIGIFLVEDAIQVDLIGGLRNFVVGFVILLQEANFDSQSSLPTDGFFLSV